jgi:hypothetical protein
MIDDHQGQRAGRANLLLRAMDGILGTHKEAARMARRNANRRHMTGDHYDRAAERQLCQSEPWTRFSAPTGCCKAHLATVAGQRDSDADHLTAIFPNLATEDAGTLPAHHRGSAPS